MPGASAIGALAPRPINRQHSPAAAAVAAAAPSNGTPAAARIVGFANRMYAIVRKVASAPRISRPMVVWRLARSNIDESLVGRAGGHEPSRIRGYGAVQKRSGRDSNR